MNLPLIVRLLIVLALVIPTTSVAAKPIILGSKKFTESYVLAEIAKRLLEQNGLPAVHRQGMGGTIILWEALKEGGITCYPEYTGTISQEILKTQGPVSLQQMRKDLARFGIGITEELGFNNTYALVMRRDRAAQLGIHTISDLQKHPDLVLGLTHEFQQRQDGWRPLAERYSLKMRDVRGIDHTLGYVALANGSIDTKDAYSTDPKIVEENLVVLRDDLHFFPSYDAVFLYRLDAEPRLPTLLNRMAGTLSQTRMLQLNAAAERTKDYAQAAALYFADNTRRSSNSLAANLVRWTTRHLLLVGISLFFSIAIGIPLGIGASRPGWLSQVIFALTGLIQTVPSLALLAVLVTIPFLGITPRTAIVALLLYGLLPIVRNTASGIQEIPLPLRESAVALGLEPRARLMRIYLPLASRSILAGIKTSAVLNVGTATLAALIGAGGLGEPIISGLNLNDNLTILEGAVPAAILALAVQYLFDFLERRLVPKGLRLGATQR